jgi:hypothetical protein
MSATDTAMDRAAPPRRCQNCGEALLGEHCYACGQPVKGLVRHFSSIIGDFLDSVFELDSRTLRTLGPLLFKPGDLSNEYFEGRRVRYVSPVRLMVFTSIVAFFAAQLTFDIGGANGEATASTRGIGGATSTEEVIRNRDEVLAELRRELAKLEEGPRSRVLRATLESAQRKVIASAERRRTEIERALAEGRPVTPRVENQISFGPDGPWNRDTNPLIVEELPPAANEWLNDIIARGQKNIARVQEDPNLLKDAVLSVLPSTLFVLLPLFAVLLKLAYLFKRRLYMEHLIVALHSHSFLSMALLLAILTEAVKGWTGVAALGWIETAVLAWMPLYLLLMQKRVYRQGWPLTLIKFALIGTLYLSMLGVGVALTVIASLVWL